MAKQLLTVLLLVTGFLFSCKDHNDGIVCTTEWRTINIVVNGATLDSFFTIREATGDTIRLSRDNSPPGNSYYPVLTDSYQPFLQGRTENFLFKGFINDSLVVNEPFVISADQCHINYVSGNAVVNL